MVVTTVGPDYRALFESSPAACLILQPNLQIYAVSNAYLEATMTVREEIVGRGLFEVFPDNPDDPTADGVSKLRASLMRVLATRAPDRMEIQKYDIRRPASEGGGFEVRYWSPINSPVLGPDGDVQQIVHFVEDVTEQRRLTEERERSRLDAERANRAKSDFLALMSHELRTPLNSIIGFSEVLVDGKFGSLNERQDRYLRNVHQSGRHLLGLINDLLDFSKIEAGKLEVKRGPCSISALVIDAIGTMQPLAQESMIALENEVAPAQPTIMADPVRTRQVLYNLLSNAIKFTPKGGRVSVSCGPTENGRLRIKVTDTGFGISAEDLARLFQPFTQLANASATSQRGTGLGLVLTKQLVELMGGVVGVDSVVGKGSTFWIELEIEPDPHPELRGVLADTQYALVVDDDPHARELIDLALKSFGLQTIFARTGEEALASARRYLPRIITLDVMLPGIDGWDVLRVLRSDPKTREIPVVMVSVSSDQNKGFSLGAADYLVKPVDRQRLVDEIRRVLGSDP